MSYSDEYTTDSGSHRLPESFFQSTDVVAVAKQLLGKVVVTHINEGLTKGRIVETEAYRAPDDRACHAWNNRRTKRTETMFARGGTAYVYLCYGIHHLFNVVTGPEETAHAVLIRGIEPLYNLDLMLSRRNMEQLRPQLSGGPGVLSKALGITTDLDGTYMPGIRSPLWLEDDGYTLAPDDLVTGTRVGVDYAGEWAYAPWRFSIRANRFVSRGKGADPDRQ